MRSRKVGRREAIATMSAASAAMGLGCGDSPTSPTDTAGSGTTTGTNTACAAVGYSDLRRHNNPAMPSAVRPTAPCVSLRPLDDAGAGGLIRCLYASASGEESGRGRRRLSGAGTQRVM